jgi:hypothetical protein
MNTLSPEKSTRREKPKNLLKTPLVIGTIVLGTLSAVGTLINYLSDNKEGKRKHFTLSTISETSNREKERIQNLLQREEEQQKLVPATDRFFYPDSGLGKVHEIQEKSIREIPRLSTAVSTTSQENTSLRGIEEKKTFVPTGISYDPVCNPHGTPILSETPEKKLSQSICIALPYGCGNPEAFSPQKRVIPFTKPIEITPSNSVLSIQDTQEQAKVEARIECMERLHKEGYLENEAYFAFGGGNENIPVVKVSPKDLDNFTLPAQFSYLATPFIVEDNAVSLAHQKISEGSLYVTTSYENTRKGVQFYTQKVGEFQGVKSVVAPKTEAIPSEIIPEIPQEVFQDNSPEITQKVPEKEELLEEKNIPLSREAILKNFIQEDFLKNLSPLFSGYTLKKLKDPTTEKQLMILEKNGTVFSDIQKLYTLDQDGNFSEEILSQ